MKKLVINADDFGYTENINRGIIHAHKNGLVSSASLFVEKDGTPAAVQFVKETPSIGIGLHVDLDKFFEIDHTRGVFTGFLNMQQPMEEVESEIKRQFDKFFSFGLQADHIDSHHHTHLHPQVFQIACKVAKEYKIPIIRLFSQFYTDSVQYERLKETAAQAGVKTIDHFIAGWYWGNVDEPFSMAELMTHPGFGELWREAELAHCCQRNLKEYFVAQQIEVLKFSEIANFI